MFLNKVTGWNQILRVLLGLNAESACRPYSGGRLDLILLSCLRLSACRPYIYNFHLPYLFYFCLVFYYSIWVWESVSHRTTPYTQGLWVYSLTGLLLRQGLWIYSSTGLLPSPRFVGFFFHRTSPTAKFRGFLFSTGLYLPMPSFVGFFFHRTLSPNAKFRGFLLPQDFISQC